MTDLADIEARHQPVTSALGTVLRFDAEVCPVCRRYWPCDVRLLLDEICVIEDERDEEIATRAADEIERLRAEIEAMRDTMEMGVVERGAEIERLRADVSLVDDAYIEIKRLQDENARTRERVHAARNDQRLWAEKLRRTLQDLSVAEADYRTLAAEHGQVLKDVADQRARAERAEQDAARLAEALRWALDYGAGRPRQA